MPIFNSECLSGLTIAVAFIFLITVEASVTGYFDSSQDGKRKFLEVLVKALKVEPGDLTSGYFGATGFKLLETPVVEVLKRENCAHLKANFKEDTSPEVRFYALSTWSILSCSGKLHTDKVVTVSCRSMKTEHFVRCRLL